MSAVTLDALGTLVFLDRPFSRLEAELARRGTPVGAAAAERALRAEMAFYRAEHHVAADAAGLADLRDRCAEVLATALPAPAGDLSRSELLDALLAALRFRPFPEVPAVLRALRAAGHRLVVVSNWDVSLHEVLHTTGLAPLLDAVLTSAELGVAKPDPGIFAIALEVAGAPAAATVHVGDSVEHDVAGALAAGVRPVLVARDGRPPEVPEGVAVVRALDALPGQVGAPRTLGSP